MEWHWFYLQFIKHVTAPRPIRALPKSDKKKQGKQQKFSITQKSLFEETSQLKYAQFHGFFFYIIQLDTHTQKENNHYVLTFPGELAVCQVFSVV